ncbi:helix-turn-helix domain-containing protein [Intrasporangium calvum]|uniref:Helix-turn-helix domain-containing protein n=1 Tax=Intrasporangium calvum TaxID=53358 RepID=A0ABT5GKB1_9MICO|nr:PucR family transcriptional regulator [Intrasporangium calvum]MDC5698340.1 helix-turn-helix domain-containing protein [Intrasporangium calvum]
MPLSPLPAPRGLPLADVVGALGGGLLRVAVASPGPEVDDVTLAEPTSGVYGQAGDLLLGVAIETSEAAVSLLEGGAAAGSGGVVLRRSVARQREVRGAARRLGVPLVELADHASWAHVVWLLRGVLDRAATGAAVRSDGPVHDDLFALADACAALVEAPVTIEDTQSRVLAYSSRQDVLDPVRLSTIVGRKVPDAVLASLRGRGVFRRLARSSDPFFVPADGDLRPRLVIPVRAANEWLGSIWALVDEQPRTETIRSLTQTASVVALHLLRLRSQTDLARRVAADRLRTLLSGQVHDAEAWLPAAPWRVVVLAGDPTLDPETRLDTWESACRRHGWRQPLLALLDDEVLGLVRHDPGDDTPGSWPWLGEVARDLLETRPHVRLSAGSPVRRLPQLARSRHEALELHRLALAGRIDPVIATAEDAWAEVTCERAVSGIRAVLSHSPIADLHAHDTEHGTAYAATLAAWLDHPGNPRAAATRVHVHPNTLRYRMSHLADVVDLDLDDPATRLAARLELRALGW